MDELDPRAQALGLHKDTESLLAGSTLVRHPSAQSAAGRVGPLVCVVTREEEAQGMFYNRTHPFMVNGTAYWPPCHGVWFEFISPSGKSYAVRI